MTKVELSDAEVRLIQTIRRINKEEKYASIELMFQKGNFERARITTSYTLTQWSKPYLGVSDLEL